MLQVSYSVSDMKPLADAISKTGANMQRELWVVTNKTAYWGRRQALKHVAKVVNTEQKNLNPAFFYKQSKPYSTTIRVSAKTTGGIPLKYFRPRQLKKKKGVSVKPYLRGGGTGKLKMSTMFMFPNGKNVFFRTGKGRRDYRLARYPQTVETYRDKGLASVTAGEIRKRMKTEIKKRVRYLLLKAAGKLRGKQPITVK